MKTQIISVSPLGRLFAVVILVLILSVELCCADLLDRRDLTTGMYIEVKPISEHWPLQARSIQIVASAEEGATGSSDGTVLTIRAPIGRIFLDESVLWILHRPVRIDDETRVPSQISSIGDLRPGQWIKAKIDIHGGDEWHAQRIEVDKVEKRLKIEGVISQLWAEQADVDSVSLSGLTIGIPANVRIDDHAPTASERIFSELVYPHDPNEPFPWVANDWFWSRGKIGVNQRFENDFTVGDSSTDHYSEAEPTLRVEFTARGPVGLSAFLKLRSRTTSVLEDAPLRQRPEEKAIHLYEGYALWRDILGAPLALQIGRQDFDEYREWIFDDQLDAVRFYTYAVHPIVVEAAYINSLDNSTDNKFRTLEDYLIHMHGRPLPSTEIGLYRLWRTDTDARGREPIWTGVRWRGEYLGIRPWLDAAWLRGWDKGRRFRADALDLGATVTRRIGKRRLSFTVANARGSGNTEDPKETGIDRQFRQTGYEDNTAAFAGVTSFQYYGEIFDPELANLDILTVGGGISLTQSTSLDIVYHRYHQSEYAPTHKRDLESTDLTLYDYGGRGVDPETGRPMKELFPYKKVGWELDVILGFVRAFNFVDVKWVGAYFIPQDALSPPLWDQLPFKPKEHSALLSQLTVEYRF